MIETAYFICNRRSRTRNGAGRIIERMQTRQVEVADSLGLHARLAARVVHVASRFKCSVSLAVKGRTANARNVVAVMLLAAAVGSTIRIEANGPDEAEAVDALSSLIGARSDR